MFKRYNLLLFSFLSVVLLHAQVYRFQNPETASMIVNPANTGNFNGIWRSQILMREQSVGFDNPFYTNALQLDAKLHYFSKMIFVGLVILNDNSFSNSLTNNELMLSGAYRLQITEHTFLSYGIQFGLGSLNNSLQNLSLPDQYNRDIGDYDSNLYTEETITGEKNFYFTINSGLLYSFLITSHKIDLGVAVYRLNKPDFGQDASQLSMPMIFNLTLNDAYVLNKSITLLPAFRYLITDKSNEYNIGFNVELCKNKFDVINALSAGFHLIGGSVQKLNAYAIVGGFTIKNWKIS